MTPPLPRAAAAAALIALALPAWADSIVRLRCDDDADGAFVFVNDQPRGQCPADVSVPPGNVRLRVVKPVGATQERVWEKTVAITDGTATRQEVLLSAPRLTAAAAQAAAKAVQDAAARGDIRAMDDLAGRHERGDGVARDAALAAQWRQRAEAARAAQTEARANAGDSAAMLEMASRHDEGKGVVRDPAAAAAWRAKVEAQKAQKVLADAQRGDVAAMKDMANRFANGQGVPADAAMAERWRKQAADTERRKANADRRAELLKKKQETKISVFVSDFPGWITKNGDANSSTMTLGFLYSPLFTVLELVTTAPSKSTDLYRINKELDSLPAAFGKPDSMMATLHRREQAGAER